MSYASSSPKRHHVLSSINPSQPSKSPQESTRFSSKVTSASPPADPRRSEDACETSQRPRSTRLKLRSPRRRPYPRTRRSVRCDSFTDNSSSSPESDDHGRRHRSRRHRRRRSSRGDTPEIPGPPPLDAETAFRESLFDAMADDEAASYWEQVYGQPIHVYSDQKVGPQGELERMTDEEYAAYVRQKMFEKTHAGLIEERKRQEEQRSRRERERQSRRERQRQDRRSHRSHEPYGDVEQSLRRGESRKLRKEWDSLWADYVNGWATWAGDVAKLPWPVQGGRRQDINEDRVRSFFVQGFNAEAMGETAFAAQLKEERVRWHPDKIQQRLGGVVDNDVMSDVTAIFQFIERLRGQACQQGGPA